MARKSLAKGSLARMPKWRMTEVMRERDRFTQSFSCSERTSYSARKLGDFQNMIKPSTERCGSSRINDALHLRLVLKFAKCLAMNYAVAVDIV
jgi:hypothetical protein